MPDLLIATNNPGKRVEIQALIEEAGVNGTKIHLALPAELGIHLDVVEDGQTYAQNAALKARAFCRASGLITLADDSGLAVDALNGAPGLHSARYSPVPGATDADRRALLLENLAGFPRPWSAHFHCTVAIAVPGQDDLYFREGDCPGEIIPQERGQNGFGYDPVFFLPDRGCTMAELSMADKNRISHRALAVKAALPLLFELLNVDS